MLPVPIAEEAAHTVPAYIGDAVMRIPIFVVERGKTCRKWLKEVCPGVVLQEKEFIEMGEAPHRDAVHAVLMHLRYGRDVAIVSESGCPGVADPGAVFAEGAHEQGFRVTPLVGPSSIILALMASGMNGQQFAFVGYLPNKRDELAKELKYLEEQARRLNQTQIFIETPYRNKQMLDTALQVLQPQTRLCMAYDVTGKNELIRTDDVQHWRKGPLPQLDKKPAIWIIGI